MGAVELATAYVSLVPTMQGAQANIASALIPEATKAGDQAGEQTGKSFGAKLKTGLTAAAAVGGAALVAGFKGLWEIGSTFDQVNKTIVVGTGASGDALDDLHASVKTISKTTPSSFGDIGTAVADLNTRLGLTGAPLEDMSSRMLNLSRLTGTDLSGNIANVTRVFGDWSIGMEDQPVALDKIFEATKRTGIGLDKLTQMTVQYGAPMRQLGFSFEESIALFGSFEKAGVNTETVMAGMRAGLGKMAKAGEEPVETFNRVVDAIKNAGSTGEANAIALEAFGQRAGPDMAAAIREGRFEIDEMVAGLMNAEGSLEDADSRTRTFSETWTLLKNSAIVALEPLATDIFDKLSTSLEGMLPKFETFAAWLTDNTWVLGVIAGLIGVTMVAAFFAWTASIWAATAALLANPMTWIVIGVMALIAALVLLILNWDTVVAWLKDVWAGIVDWLGGVWDSITSGVESAWNGIKDFFSGLWTSIKTTATTQWNNFTTWLSGIWDSIKSTATSKWNSIVDWIKGIPGKIYNAFLNFTVIGLLIKHWDSIKSTATEKWNSLLDWIKGIPARFLNNLRAIGNIAGDMGRWVLQMKDAAVDKFNSLVDWVKNIPSRIVSALGNVGNLLASAGRNILEGFLGGLKDKWESVKNFVGGIGDWIKNNKGPKAYDLALLRPAGQWIMTGLSDSMEDEIPQLERTLGRVTSAIKTGASLEGQMSADLRGTSVAPYSDGGDTFIIDGLEFASSELPPEVIEFFKSLRRHARQKAGV